MKFEVNKIYWTRSSSDYDSIIRVLIVSRTEKTVTIQQQGFTPPKKPQIKRIHVYEEAMGEESFSLGRYSGAPTFFATTCEASFDTTWIAHDISKGLIE
jgi:hypothetical protein